MSVVLYDWPFLALALGLFGVVVLLAMPRPAGAPSRWRDPSWLACLMLPIYMIHQFEEHGFDLLGRRFHFIVALCENLGHRDLADCPADAAFILAVNVGAVWIAGALAIVYRKRNPLVGACAWGIPLVNSFTHFAAAIARREYNPGLLTAALLFLPLGVFVMRAERRAGVLGRRGLVVVVASGVAVHVVLAAGLLAFGRGLIPRSVNLAVQVANGFVPLLFAQRRRSYGS